jgi:hypothetical protein
VYRRGESLSLKLRLRRFGCRSGPEAVDRNTSVIPLVRPTEREVKARAAAYRLWKPRASEHEAVAELRDHVLYVHYRGDRVVLVVGLGDMVVDGPTQGCFDETQNDVVSHVSRMIGASFHAFGASAIIRGYRSRIEPSAPLSRCVKATLSFWLANCAIGQPARFSRHWGDKAFVRVIFDQPINHFGYDQATRAKRGCTPKELDHNPCSSAARAPNRLS